MPAVHRRQAAEPCLACPRAQERREKRSKVAAEDTRNKGPVSKPAAGVSAVHLDDRGATGPLAAACKELSWFGPLRCAHLKRPEVVEDMA